MLESKPVRGSSNELPKRTRGGLMETAPLDNPIVRRIFRTVAILVDHPGISLDDLIVSVSQEEGVQVSSATVRRDLAKLKEWGILQDRSHRKGYFLGSLSLTLNETKATVNAIRSHAEDLKHPLALAAYRELSKRLEVYDLAAYVGGYPTTSVLHRVGVASRGEDEEVMLEALAEAMNLGKQVTLRRQRDPWGKGRRVQDISMFPLQFQFHEQAWYLLAEVVGERIYRYQLLRLDRLHPAVTPLDAPPRGRKVQLQALEEAQGHQRRGWYPWVPPSGPGWEQLPLAPVRIRFVPQVASFFHEMPNRHPSQKLEPQADGSLIVAFTLPQDEPTLFHVQRWVMSWGEQAEVMGPASLREGIKLTLTRAASAYL